MLYFTVIVGRQPYTVSLGERNSPTANSALWLVDKCHDLTVEAVVIFSADVIKLALYAVKETADSFAVLTGDFALLLPKIPIADAFIVSYVQKSVCGNSYKICFFS